MDYGVRGDAELRDETFELFVRREEQRGCRTEPHDSHFTPQAEIQGSPPGAEPTTTLPKPL